MALPAVLMGRLLQVLHSKVKPTATNGKRQNLKSVVALFADASF